MENTNYDIDGSLQILMEPLQMLLSECHWDNTLDGYFSLFSCGRLICYFAWDNFMSQLVEGPICSFMRFYFSLNWSIFPCVTCRFLIYSMWSKKVWLTLGILLDHSMFSIQMLHRRTKSIVRWHFFVFARCFPSLFFLPLLINYLLQMK